MEFKEQTVTSTLAVLTMDEFRALMIVIGNLPTNKIDNNPHLSSVQKTLIDSMYNSFFHMPNIHKSNQNYYLKK